MNRLSQEQIRIAQAKLLRSQATIEGKLAALREQCKHPGKSKTYRANTGNYDPSADHYWIEYDCPDCGRAWSESQ